MAKTSRAKPGSTGEGEYYRVVIRDKKQFKTFRNHDIGDKGHIQRLAGKCSDGSWDTQAWLISKDDAHKSGQTLVADTDDAKAVFDEFKTKPKALKGDIFQAKLA